MMKYHVNPKTGNPSVCHAVIQCRFGGEADHYFTKDQAREDYEKKNAAFSTPESLRSTDEITRARKTRKPEEIKRIIAAGHEAPLIKLASNRHVTSDDLREIWNKSDSDLVKTAVALNPKSPVEIIDKERMLDFKFRGIEDQLKKKLESDNVTEHQARIVVENFATSKVSEAILANPNTKVSQKTLADLAISTNNGEYLQTALMNPKFDAEEARKVGFYSGKMDAAVVTSKGPEARQFIYNHPSSDKRTRDILTERWINEKFGK